MEQDKDNAMEGMERAGVLPGVEFRVVADEAEAVAVAAGWVLEACRGAGGGFGLGLSGGRVAPAFYRELVRRDGEAGVGLGLGLGLAGADFFWCDERCVGPGDEASNYRVAVEGLMGPLGVVLGGGRVHRLAGELAPGLAADAANRDWAVWTEGRRGRGRRAGLDCAVLGVGEDGHVASLFPGNMVEDLGARAAFRAVRGPKPPPDRLTLGYRELWEAGSVVVLAVGAGKAEVVRGSVSGGLDTPLGRVLRGRVGLGTRVVAVRGVSA